MFCTPRWRCWSRLYQRAAQSSSPLESKGSFFRFLHLNISIKHMSRSWVSGYRDGAELSPLEWSQPAALRISPMLMRAWGMRGADQYFISPFMFIFSLCVLFRSVDLTAQKRCGKTHLFLFCFYSGLQLFSFSTNSTLSR